MKTNLTIIFILFLTGGVRGQVYNTTASLDRVTQSGYYRIPINPELTAQAREDLADIRIEDGNRNQVPYILRMSRGLMSRQSFIEFSILNLKTDTSRTIIELDAGAATGISNLSLLMANTAVERFTSMSGSNERNSWYIIKDRILLQNAGENRDGSYVQTIHFPYTRYRFLKLEIRNEHTDPLNILKAGIYRDTVTAGAVMLNPLPQISTKDSSNRRSYISIRNSQPFPAGSITFITSGPRFYKREARLLAAEENGVLQEWGTVLLTSDHATSVQLDGRKFSGFSLIIENGDNPALKMEKVFTEQDLKYLVAYLEKGKAYRITAGNPSARRPDYDINHFNERIPQDLATIGYGPLKFQTQESRTAPQFEWNYVLWAIIGIGILLIGYFCYRLMNEMKKVDH